MREVPDRVVTVFLFLAIASTIGGFIVILAEIGGDYSFITGFATEGTAQVNVTISSTTAITITPAIVEFGTGTLSGVITTRINTSAETNLGGFDEPSPINVTNDGNTEVNITINGTVATEWLNTGSTYEWLGEVTQEGGCGAGNLTTTRTPFTAAEAQVCTNLTYTDSADTVSIHIFLNLSNDLGAGASYLDNAVVIRAQVHTA